MAVHIEGLLEKTLNDKIKESKILVVGAGGIGCELLKSLVLTGFENITVVDLDTIELSNLNRQFLFHKQHIGRPKAIVAKESVLKFNPKANIEAIHDSITKLEYDTAFFKQFTVVTNALDNVAARSHVNRMCLSANVPLIESGSAGYLGQVTVYKKTVTECFECLPRKGQKSFPSCTIRNTPSEPAHCIVWAKHLFNQLFGESDADNEVSPDMTDPELGNVANKDGNVARIRTKEWAKASNYDPVTIFKKLFVEDIEYLNTMNDLWETRKRPIVLDWDSLSDAVPGSSKQVECQIKDQRLWSLKECADVFAKCLGELKKQSEESGECLVWDKDDDIAMDFVAACANFRCHCFHIEKQSRFDAKAIAGNIIPAIASTNAVISGLIVLQVMKVLQGDFSKCRTAWLNENVCAGKILSSTQLEKPNPKCYACSGETREIFVKVNLNTLTIRTVNEKILKEKLLMVQAEVTVTGEQGARIIISGDPDELDDDLYEKTLADMKIAPNSQLHCFDDLQQHQVNIILKDNSEIKDQDFVFESDLADVLSPPTPKKEEKKEEAPIKIPEKITCDIDDLELLEPPKTDFSAKKNVLEDGNGDLPPAKRVKTD